MSKRIILSIILSLALTAGSPGIMYAAESSPVNGVSEGKNE